MSAAEALEARRRLDWSQTQLAEALGIHPMTVSKWERGEQDPPPYLRLALDRLLWLAGKGPLEMPDTKSK